MASYTLSPIGGAGWQFFDNNGVPLAGGKIYTYAAGTTTPQATWTTPSGTTANTNPIILDSAGRPPQEIWLNVAYSYKFSVETSTGILIRTYDNIPGLPQPAIVNDASSISYEQGNTVTAGSFVIGRTYMIASVGSTDFVAIGATANSTGVLFVATGAGSGTGTAYSVQTVADKLQQYVSVKDFGAVGDGVTDDTAAIQACLDAFKPNSGSAPEKGGDILIPEGVYIISLPIKTYSGINLFGEGASSVLKAAPSLSGQIIELASVDGSVQYRYGSVCNLGFKATTNVWAIKSTAGLLLNSQIRNIYLDVQFGISVCYPNTYTQATLISGVVSVGPIDQIIALSGNFNSIEHVDKEGGTGTSTDPYIYLFSPLGDVDGNSLKQILLEGAGSANKTPIKFSNANNTTLDGYWMEASNTNGFVMELDNSSVTVTGVTAWSTFALGKVKIRNSSNLQIDYMGTGSEDLDWQPFIDSDASSICYINTMLGRRAANVYKIASSENIKIARYINENWLQSLPSGYGSQSFPDYTSGQNLLVNPSFEAGLYGWGLSSVDIPTFVASEVGQGLMLSCASTTGFQLTQNITVSPAQVGQPLTIRYACNIVGAGFVVPLIANDAQLGANRISAGTGWHTVTLTFRPASSGSMAFGLWWVGVGGTASTIYVDEMSVSCGAQGLMNPSKFGSFELSQKTFLCATAAPTTGTWKVGDRVFNSAPSVGAAKSWVCTVAGSPGTWVSEGNL